jgi:hypothetical protein|tara:strand:+ start:985 stop:1212 length:228 start_codon:yes stop_codon:yes gene_type:complete
MKNKGKKYAFKTEESYSPNKEYCHYSGLPSPSAYGRDDIDYDGMGNQGRVPNVEVKSKLSLIQKIKNKLWEVKNC